MKAEERSMTPEDALNYVIGKLREEEAKCRIYKVLAHSLLDEFAEGAAKAVAENRQELKRRMDMERFVEMEPVTGAIN